MKIKLTNVIIDDQEKTLRFYTAYTTTAIQQQQGELFMQLVGVWRKRPSHFLFLICQRIEPIPFKGLSQRLAVRCRGRAISPLKFLMRNQ